jgi:CBS domain containing-hemolysin-like protein
VIAILVGLLLILINGFFVATEFALLAASRTRLEVMSEDGSGLAHAAVGATRRLGVMLAGTQLGITLASLGLGAVAEPALDHIFHSLFVRIGLGDTATRVLALLVALSIVVFLHLLVGEMIPKSLALSAPERVLMFSVFPARLFVTLCLPLIALLNTLARAGARLCGVTPIDELRNAHTAAEIGVMLEESRDEGLLEQDESELLTGALAFVGHTVADVVIPQDRVVTVPLQSTVAAVEAVVHRNGHSRIVVTAPDTGRFLGFVHIKDLMRLPDSARHRPMPRDVLRLTFSVEPDAPLADVVVRMRGIQRHLAFVHDEQRRQIGMITLEDIVESIVGDINDESDRRVSRRSFG